MASARRIENMTKQMTRVEDMPEVCTHPLDCGSMVRARSADVRRVLFSTQLRVVPSPTGQLGTDS